MEYPTRLIAYTHWPKLTRFGYPYLYITSRQSETSTCLNISTAYSLASLCHTGLP